MKVIRAKSAGFCWGVERAVNIARDIAVNKGKAVYTDGPLIHNKQMMDKLQADGIKEVGDYHSKSELTITDQEKEDTVMVVRAHGISPERRKYLKGLDMTFKDATCPDVGMIAGKIKLHTNRGYTTVIFGDPDHPEVIGLMGYTKDRGHVIQTPADILNLPPLGDKVCMVSQSTMFTHSFAELSDLMKAQYPDILVFDTICGATKERQSDIITLVQEGCDVIVVIGGKHSANTKKLAKLASLQNLPTYHIETAQELDFEKIKQFQTVGVTAGASTPNFMIDAVCKQLELL